MLPKNSTAPVNPCHHPNFLPTAIRLARMYGVGETLNDIPYLAMGDFLPMILEWTEEYLNRPEVPSDKESDLIHFFQCKMQKTKQAEHLIHP